LSPKISVVMAVYNKEAYLQESIESVLNQSFRDFELLCVDAGSTDGSLQVLGEYAAKDPKVTVHNTPYTAVPAVTKNYGIDHSRGKYVFLLDADDCLSPDALQNMYNKAETSGADAVLVDLQTVSEQGEVLEQKIVGLNSNRDAILTGREAVVESLDWTIHAFALWRGDLIRRLRLEEFGVYSDEYSSRVWFFNCGKVAFCEGTYFYRRYPESITGKTSLRTYDRPLALYKLALFLEQNGFDEKDVCSYHFSTFKDCCYLMRESKKLDPNDRVVAQEKVREVFNLVDKQRVRESVSMTQLGRTEIWKVEGKAKKYYFAALSAFNWGLFKAFSSRIFFW
jgi:glycosyltransferase involved in cell wall biosynthesis